MTLLRVFVYAATFFGAALGVVVGCTLSRWLKLIGALEQENQRLRSWIDAQGRRPDLGPHRSAEVAPRYFQDHREDLMNDRLPRPRPTTVPGSGRKLET